MKNFPLRSFFPCLRTAGSLRTFKTDNHHLKFKPSKIPLFDEHGRYLIFTNKNKLLVIQPKLLNLSNALYLPFLFYKFGTSLYFTQNYFRAFIWLALIAIIQLPTFYVKYELRMFPQTIHLLDCGTRIMMTNIHND